jgi:hypothetical protein
VKKTHPTRGTIIVKKAYPAHGTIKVNKTRRCQGTALARDRPSHSSSGTYSVDFNEGDSDINPVQRNKKTK